MLNEHSLHAAVFFFPLTGKKNGSGKEIRGCHCQRFLRFRQYQHFNIK